VIASLGFSFTNFQLNKPEELRFVGLDNYIQLFHDPLLATSLSVTIKYAIIALPIAVILPIVLASLLNSKHLMGKHLFRTLFYMPYIVPLVSAVYIWQGMLNSETGWFNRFLDLFGIDGPNWVDSVTWIYPALVIISLWGLGNAYLITLAGMQSVPTELYESATVDGAGAWSRFRNITLPMITPVIFYNLILTVVDLFRYFEIPFILKGTTGNPGSSTWFFNMHFYKTTFTFLNMGYGSTLAWLLFLITLVVTLGLFYSARYWVYYASGDEF
jgi:multiple sugar transport system permease protein